MVKYGRGWMVAVEFLATMQPKQKKKKKQSPRFIKKKKRLDYVQLGHGHFCHSALIYSISNFLSMLGRTFWWA